MPKIYIWIQQEVIGLDVSVNVAQTVELLNDFHHLNADFQNVYYSKIFFPLEKNLTDGATQQIENDEPGEMLDALYLLRKLLVCDALIDHDREAIKPRLS